MPGPYAVRITYIVPLNLTYRRVRFFSDSPEAYPGDEPGRGMNVHSKDITVWARSPGPKCLSSKDYRAYTAVY